jgi:hypothetical protein
MTDQEFANQLFVINAIKRSDIASDVNDYLEAGEFTTDTGPLLLAADDERLTDELCQGYADALSDIDGDNEDEVSENVAMWLLEELGYTSVEQVVDEAATLRDAIERASEDLRAMRARLAVLEG